MLSIRCKKLYCLHFQLTVLILQPHPFCLLFLSIPCCTMFSIETGGVSGRTTSDLSVPNLLKLKSMVQTSLTSELPAPCNPSMESTRAYVSLLFVIQELSSMIADSIITVMEQLAQGGTYVTFKTYLW